MMAGKMIDDALTNSLPIADPTGPARRSAQLVRLGLQLRGLQLE